MINENLIYDLGFHNGDDSRFYLARGFDVIAIEANPALIDIGKQQFISEISCGRLKLLHRAISDTPGEVDFYIHSSKSDWSSCLIEMAESDGSTATKIVVDSVSLQELFSDHGVPHYLKVDVEGCDTFVARQLSEAGEKPSYVSFEISKTNFGSIFAYLNVSGYKSYQLINQSLHQHRNKPAVVNEGADIDYSFSPYSSGFFGEDLDESKWLSFEEMITRYIMYKELKKKDNQELGVGWIDVHARLERS